MAEQGRIVSAPVFRIFHRIQRISEIPPICLGIQQILSKFYEEAETSERVGGSSLKFRFRVANSMDQVRF